MITENDYWNQMYSNAVNASAAHVTIRPKLFIDGDKWCALYGEDLQNGCSGFGDSPELAMLNFDREWSKKLTTTKQPKE